MSRFYTTIIPIFVIIFLALSLTARAFGESQPANLHPTLRGFAEGCEGKLQPCWYGIVLGETTVPETSTILNDLGYGVRIPQVGTLTQVQGELRADINCKVFSDPYDDTVFNLAILNCEPLLLGDLIRAWGMPVVVYGCDSRLIPQPQILFPDVRVRLNHWPFGSPGQTVQLSPYYVVRDLAMAVPVKNEADRITGLASTWHGFIPYWRYERVEQQGLKC
jgi:hypothetical protein